MSAAESCLDIIYPTAVNYLMQKLVKAHHLLARELLGVAARCQPTAHLTSKAA
jgi:hypothetical protein